MNDIGIFIYSYQNKQLINSIENIVNKSSGLNKLFFYIIDQNNIDRTRSITIDNNNVNIIYNYVKWDSIKSPILYKNESLKILNKQYHMQISDDVDLIKNWDILLINFIQNKKNIILSGNNKTIIENKNLFFINKKQEIYNDFYKNNFIDRDFIFGEIEKFFLLKYPIELKYYGEEEEMSINLINNNIDIYSIPSNYIINNSIKLENQEYVPFSLTHNYNKFINKNKKYLKEYYSVNIENIPFEDNDVEYDIQKSKIDRIGGLRYINKIKEIG